MQHQIASLATEIEAARLLTYNAARLRDANLPFVKQAAMAKLFSSEVGSSSILFCRIVSSISSSLEKSPVNGSYTNRVRACENLVCLSSIDFMGGLGFSCEYPQEKFFRDCKVGT